MLGAGHWLGAQLELFQAVYTQAVYTPAVPVAWVSQHGGGVRRGSLPESKSSQMEEEATQAESQDRYCIASLILLWPCNLRATELRKGNQCRPSVCVCGAGAAGRKILQASLTSHCDQQTIVEYKTEFHRQASSRELAPGEDWRAMNGTVSPLPKQHCSPASLTACGDPLGPKPYNTACDLW